MSSEQRAERVVPVEVTLRRFFREVQQSDVMTEIKRRKNFERKLSRNRRRNSAIEKAARRRVRQAY